MAADGFHALEDALPVMQGRITRVQTDWTEGYDCRFLPGAATEIHHHHMVAVDASERQMIPVDLGDAGVFGTAGVDVEGHGLIVI